MYTLSVAFQAFTPSHAQESYLIVSDYLEGRYVQPFA
jgi:hypothetical protein